LFFWEYSARKGFSHSETNQLILNFKKPIDRKEKPEWQHKMNAIGTVATAFSLNIDDKFALLTLVPVPPSKMKSDPLYDDRMMDMLRQLRAPAGMTPDIRELIKQTRPMAASHGASNRLPPDEWENVYVIDEALTSSTPTWIGIIDDLLVTGCRFRAMSNVLKKRFPDVRITGLFLARRVPEAIDLTEMFGVIDDLEL
jgi:predicted amidophosphoribosyltransferase